MASDTKEILHESIFRKKSLRLNERGEPSHRTFLLSIGLVRNLCSFVRVDVVEVIHSGHDCTMNLHQSFEFYQWLTTVDRALAL